MSMIDDFKDHRNIVIENHISNKNFNKQKTIEKRFDKLINYINTHDFDIFLLRLIYEHNINYKELCYCNGEIPHANNKLQLLLDYISLNCSDLKNIKGIDNNYEQSEIFEYKKYYFQNIYTNGEVITNIFNKDDMRLLLHI